MYAFFFKYIERSLTQPIKKGSRIKSPRQNPPDQNPPEKKKKFKLRFFVATLFRFVARFARVRIEDSSLNRFALNGI